MSYELIPGARTITSGLEAEQTRMRLVAQNMAHAGHTAREAQDVYRRQQAVFRTVLDEQSGGARGLPSSGVEVTEVVESEEAPQQVYLPGHPDADPKTGMVFRSNVNPLEEMVDMMAATRAYEANLAVMRQAKKIAENSINLGKSNG